MAVSLTVCEIFSVKEGRDLKNRDRVCSRSLEMSPFDIPHTRSVTGSIVLSCIISKIKRDIGRKSLFYIPPCILSPVRGVTDGILL